MTTKVLVVGGAGYIGSHMTRYLLGKDVPTVVLDNLSNGHKQAVPLGVPFYHANMQERAMVEKILEKEKITHVFHFAAHAYVGESMTQPLKYYDNNVAATVALLQAMQNTGVKFFIFSSSCATYGIPQQLPITESSPQQPINPYGHTKLVIENLLRAMAAQKQIGYAALRYFNASGAAYGIGEDHRPETHLIPLALQVALGQREKLQVFGSDYPTPDGTCLRDYVHVSDLASAHWLALKKLTAPGDALELNLGTGKPSSVMEVVQACRQVTGHAIPVEMFPRRPGDPAELSADNTLAKKVLGWSPAYTELTQIIQDAWGWHRQNPEGYRQASQPTAAVSS